MLRIVVMFLVAGCTSFVNGPSRRSEQTFACTDSYALPAIDAGLSASLIAGSVYAAKADTFEDCGGLGCFLFPLGISLAIMMPIASAHGFERVHACRETKARIAKWTAIEEARAARQRARDHAWILTKEAMTAARADNCDSVRTLGARVRAEDADFHATVFVRDVAIARCL